MAYGLLASKALANGVTEYELYQAPLNKRAVGTIVVVNSDTILDHRVSIFITSATGSVSGMYNNALSNGLSEYGFLVLGGLCKTYTSDDGVPLTISGVVIGPNQRLVALDNGTGSFAVGDRLLVSFNGVEEDV